MASAGAPGSAGPTTDIGADLAADDARFGLPVTRFQVLGHLAGTAAAALAGPEEVIDVEAVHAIAPAAGIRVLLIPRGTSVRQQLGRYVTALRYLIDHDLADVISISQCYAESVLTRAELTALNATLQAADQAHVTVLAASGDFGPVAKPCVPPTASATHEVKETVLPASDPLVTSVGGTTLDATQTGRYISETAWNEPAGSSQWSSASGGGFSRWFARPSYQDAVNACAQRGLPDVAADASPGLATVVVFQARAYTLAAGGTSIATPIWAALAALADQYANQRLGLLNPLLYQIARSRDYRTDFHDIIRKQHCHQPSKAHPRLPGRDGLGPRHRPRHA